MGSEMCIRDREDFGKLSAENQLRLSRLNSVPSRPMSARFTLADNSVDSKTILDKIVTMGIQRTHVTCIQRFRSGQVDVTFPKRELRELFLSKVATTFEPIISGELAQNIIALIVTRRGTSPMSVRSESSALSVSQKSTWRLTALGTGADARWLKELHGEKKRLRRHTQEMRN